MFKFKETVKYIKSQFPGKDFIPLHEPFFSEKEKEYVLDTINTTFVSSVGAYVDRFEIMMSEITQTKKAIAVVNGTAGLQVALRLAGVKAGDEVLTQALTFVATANSIAYNDADPIFLDVDLDTMGLSPDAIFSFLNQYAEKRGNGTYNKKTGKKIAACVPMHTFGFMCRIEEIVSICDAYNIPVVEDAAEALGSSYRGKSAGSFGKLGVFSFNGNKIVTSGGGGAIVSNDSEVAQEGKHLTTTAKIPHPYEYFHDAIGYNFRMPNLNAALACAQLERLNFILEAKSILADKYENFFQEKGILFRKGLPDSKSNYWLMCLELEDKSDRDLFLKTTNDAKIMTRPIWQLMFHLPMYSHCQKDEQKNAKYLEARIVNIPSSVSCN